MAATTTSVVAVMLILLAALSLMISVSNAQQTCSSSLGRLNACSPFLVPGGAAPNADCCAALQGIDHDCICNTIRIASRIPTQCHLPALTCGAN